MKKEDQDKVGKILMGLWNLGTQKEEYVHKIAEYMTE